MAAEVWVSTSATTGRWITPAYLMRHWQDALAKMRWRCLNRSNFAWNKALYMCGASGFYRKALLFQVANELASCGDVAGNPELVVAELLQMRSKVCQHRLGPRPG